MGQTLSMPPPGFDEFPVEDKIDYVQNLWGSTHRWWLLVCVGSAMTAGACTNDNCVPNPGVCPPSPACVDGFRSTGSASCDNGEWVCERVACAPDAGICDGACPDASLD